ncbi:MAG: aminotransferase class I/II-fold pyridoxal phosphate-dependent enzyme, partial [Calditrichaeota bacterium]|nr:aminotransferase class I/II-fold pyridoxal phosphate-dependent enzyme [Calditrichota bacterium]
MIIPSANRLSQVEEYYFSKKLAEVRSLTQKGRPIINLAIGNPDMPPSATTIETLNRNAALPNVHGYQPYRGAPELRLAMAEYYSRTYGVMLDANAQILPLLGSKEGIFHISMAFLNPG